MKSKMLNHQPRLNIATTLVQQFETTVKQSSNHSALISPRKQLSYQQLNEQANQVAAQLQRLAIHSEQFIGLHLELSIEAVIGLWGILKAGGAFVPIDPSYPPDRIQHILNETQISIILTSRAGAGGLPSHQAKRLYVDELSTDSLIENHQSKVENPSHLACCLYTSGSTGQPKGVLLEHQALVKHFTSLQQHYQLTPADRVLQFASLTHIAGVEQIIMALLSGATLIVPEQKLWTVSEFLPKVKQYGLTMVDLPASYYQTLAQEWVTSRTTLQDSPLRLLIVGGEVTSTEGGMLWSKLAASNIHFLNVYGMTEVSGTATLFEMPTHFSQNWHSLPIGQALPNRTIYLMDEPLRPVPDGENGEICIGGASLARGYLNQPVLTAEKFVVNPVGEGRLYRTGDLGRFLPDGNLEYLGRKDYQVQIRGFRVELGEIEAALLTHPTVKEAVVMAHGEGANKQLAAYAVCQNTVNNTPMQSFWQPDEQYKNEKGVLTNLTERMAFKLQQNNLRSDLTSQIKLQKPITDEIKQQYLIRQSYRQFVNKAISLQSLTQFLNCLYQLNLPDTPLPKYRYPSALGLYAVQSYFYFKPDQIEGIDGGFYYYHPHEHELQLIQENGQIPITAYAHFDRPTYKQAGFALFLVAHLEAIIPMYGEKMAREFCLLEAGYMGQLLMEEAPKAKLGLCPIGLLENVDPINQGFQFNETHFLVHSFLGGAIEPAQTKTWLQPTTNQQSLADLKTDLQSYLKEKLPPHTVPEQLILCEQLPRTPNGKVDRQALANITNEADTSKHYIAPRTPTEQTVVQIWQELLKLEPVGVTNEFFALGGNSLLALQLLSKIEQRFQVTLPLQTLLSHNTVEQLAQQVDAWQSLETIPSDMSQEDYEEGIL